MGYTTKFSGQFKIEPPLSAERRDELLEIARDMSDDDDARGPDSYCQWEPTADGAALRWDGGEKFYNYVEWLQYLIDSRFGPWGHTVTGSVKWSGEDASDNGVLTVEGNKVTEHKADAKTVAVYVPLALIERHAEDGDAAEAIAKAVVASARATGGLRG